MLYNYNVYKPKGKAEVHHIILNKAQLNGKNEKKLNAVKRVFNNAGIDYKVIFTAKPSEVREYTKRITGYEGKNVIIAMGGDGTIHEILNGFENFGNNSLGLIPFGTGNDFACSAGIPDNVKKAAEIIAFNAPSYIDYIELSSGLRSINAVGMGIDVDVLKRTYRGNGKGRSKYLKSLIVSLSKFKSCNFTVKYDGKEEKHYGLIAALGNGRQFGGGIKLFPEAKINDGYMDMFLVDYISKIKMIDAFIKLMRGKVNDIKEATAIRTKAATFIHEDKNFTIQAEGELYENVPLEARLITGKLKFFLPSFNLN